MGELSKVINIGKVVEKQLITVGITTLDELIECGSTEAWLRIQQIDSSACINRLMALEGAIQGIRWHDLSDREKQYLKNFYNDHKVSWNK